jgi:hypothetical protein
MKNLGKNAGKFVELLELWVSSVGLNFPNIHQLRKKEQWGVGLKMGRWESMILLCWVNI